MVEFSKHISEKWNIEEKISRDLCTSFESGLNPYFLADYSPTISIDMDITQIWEVYDYLAYLDELNPKKKRVLSAWKKANALSEEIQQRVKYTITSHELDDMLLPYRPNVRSRGQMALKKGLGELADIVEAQQEEETPLEVLAEKYIEKHPSLKKVDDVINGVRDILAERFAYDETVRAMAREFCREDGDVQVTPKNKKDPRFSKYVNKFIPLNEVSQEDFLLLSMAEDKKEVRFKISVQLFRITEMLRHHFIENPDSVGFDIICDAIDDSWQRLLFPIIERDVKLSIRTKAEEWASKELANALKEKFAEESSYFSILVVRSTKNNGYVCIGVDSEGRLQGASVEKKPVNKDNPGVSDKIKKFLVRNRPTKIFVCGEGDNEVLKTLVSKTLEVSKYSCDIENAQEKDINARIWQSQWMKENFSDLDSEMQRAFSVGLSYCEPFQLLPIVGSEFFDLHPIQKLIPVEKVNTVLDRIVLRRALRGGILIRDILNSPLKQLPGFAPELFDEISRLYFQKQIVNKSDLQSVPKISREGYLNIAGYIVFPESGNPLDATTVHPEMFDVIEKYSEDLHASIDVILGNPEILNSLEVADFNESMYVKQSLIPQLTVGKKYYAKPTHKPKRKLRLDEIHEDMILQGKVTNIAPFGVFVNINAVCDGLIHISQLADTFVETPEQVVSVHDEVHVKVVKVDTKKRRISLSMKGLGGKAPKVKPSTDQLNTLVDHFSQR